MVTKEGGFEPLTNVVCECMPLSVYKIIKIRTYTVMVIRKDFVHFDKLRMNASFSNDIYLDAYIAYCWISATALGLLRFLSGWRWCVSL